MTKDQYIDARHKLDAYTTASNQWMAENKTNDIPVGICNTFPFANEISNEMRSSIEVYEFTNMPPDNYFLYIDEEKSSAITWLGDNLGNVTFGREYTSNMGDKRQSISIWAINGKTYFGTYYKSCGNYARVKARKQPKQ